MQARHIVPLPSSRFRLVLAAALLAALTAVPAAAGPLDGARAAWSEGRFLEAADMAEETGGPEGLAFAAESLVLQASYLAAEQDRPALFERALALAMRAVEAAPDEAYAHIAAARVMGRHGQTLSTSEASDRGYAGKIRDSLERALELKPASVKAMTGLAIWHARVVEVAGSFLARITYGAREKSVHELFGRVFEAAPGEKVPLFEYARALRMLDGDMDRARDLLRQAMALPAKNAYQRIVDERAAKLLAEIEAGG
ncbi:MAG: hypothetical protein OXH14_15545 [Alphaproteobacteria bacterium]|nr:hypothetical protein [Alphaproteobacteria bacterium]